MIENDKYFLDSVFKKCVCCGQLKTLRNYRIDRTQKSTEGGGIIDIFSKVCKCCEKNSAMQLKSNRIEMLRAKMAHFKENEKARLEAEKVKIMHEELAGIRYLKKDKQ